MYPMYRVMEEIEEVMGDKPDIEADDLEKLTYMTQVLCKFMYGCKCIIGFDNVQCTDFPFNFNRTLQCINALSLAVPVF